MADQKNEDRESKSSDYQPPKGAASDNSLRAGGSSISYKASADWLILRKKEKPKAEMFHVSYIAEGDGSRPITFVFNGGPGASSVYLHLGAMGPRRAVFGEHGESVDPPARLADNEHSWLAFTDLVFIDPIGTGFSRMIEDEKEKKEDKAGDGDKPEGSEYWQLKRDLESLGEFISKYLSKHQRWESPVYIAGESYGGFRTAKLTKLLQQDYGVGLNGAVIISPALEFTLLDGSDYDVLGWIDTFPSMAGAAWVHKKARRVKEGESLMDYMRRAGDFAIRELLPALAAGDMYGRQAKERVLVRAADFIGLSREVLKAKNGRIPIDYFVKNLLRDRGKHLGLYDASLTVEDPYPDRDSYSGPDPTLHVIERIFASGINSQLRAGIGLDTERDYELLSMTVNQSWKIDTRQHALDSQVGATDDLRYGISLNPSMKVFITHGVFDLVTPFFSAERLTNLMKLSDEQKARMTVKHYGGGHMFYTWDESRKAFFEDIREFYASSGGLS
jgi:carboxypeptidase C (cathepsin A)